MGHFEKIVYPDGQVSAKFINKKELVTIVNERINSYSDLLYVRACAEILQNKGMSKIWKLIIPCMFGQRSDRRFDTEQSFDLKLITDVINQCEFGGVEVFDPHSDVCMALINNSVKRSSFEYVEKSYYRIIAADQTASYKNIVLVSPDAGAYKKVFEFGEKLNLPVVAAVKHRDVEGKVDLTFMGDVKDKHCLIVDDLCSRGGTFLKLTEQLKVQGAQKIYLYVSHFEGGCEEYKQTIINLREKIDWIYTTNSFREFDEADNKNLTVYKVI